MAGNHKRLLKAALDAVEDLFSDTTVSKRDTLESIEEVASSCEGKIDALTGEIKAEIKAEEGEE